MYRQRFLQYRSRANLPALDLPAPNGTWADGGSTFSARGRPSAELGDQLVLRHFVSGPIRKQAISVLLRTINFPSAITGTFQVFPSMAWKRAIS